MTRRGGTKSAAHVQRVQSYPNSALLDAKEKDFLLRKHRLLRRATGFMLARKYRASWHLSPTEYAPEPRATRPARSNSTSSRHSNQLTHNDAGTGCVASKGYTREELVNFWKDLPVVAKRALLRIHRDVYLTALDQYLVRHNLCCECHDNVIAEWEDHERRRSGSRSLQDVFSVFPPFLDDDDDDDDDDEEDDDEEDDDEEDDDEEDEHCHHEGGESDDELLETDDVLLDDEEVVFKYELDRDEFRRAAAKTGMLSDEYLSALDASKHAADDELMRLIQKEERYIIIREDHTEFIMDLIRCGEHFSYISPIRPAYDDDSEGEDEDDDAECPGANTSHLAQEYLLEVLAIKFREQLETAYQAALQHSLAVQAELLRDEIADLQRTQKASKNKKKKDKKKKKRKDSAVTNGTTSTNGTAASTQSRKDRSTSNQSESDSSDSPQSVEGTHSNQFEPTEDEEHDDTDSVDREVEEFRRLLEKIHSQNSLRPKPKLVLPPGAFSMS